jgi:hypothetical protein
MIEMGWSPLTVLTVRAPVRWFGNISLAVKPNSDIVYSGYAALQTKVALFAKDSLGRCVSSNRLLECVKRRLRLHAFDDRCVDLDGYKFMVLRIKGDHRNYCINFKTKGSALGDLYMCRFRFANPYQWEEIKVGVTLGPQLCIVRPCWQYAYRQLPFSHFLLSHKGQLKRSQTNPSLSEVTNIGFLLADNLPGPFNVELDWIKVTQEDYMPADYEKYLTDVNAKRIVQPWYKQENYGVASEAGGHKVYV